MTAEVRKLIYDLGVGDVTRTLEIAMAVMKDHIFQFHWSSSTGAMGAVSRIKAGGILENSLTFRTGTTTSSTMRSAS